MFQRYATARLGYNITVIHIVAISLVHSVNDLCCNFSTWLTWRSLIKNVTLMILRWTKMVDCTREVVFLWCSSLYYNTYAYIHIRIFNYVVEEIHFVFSPLPTHDLPVHSSYLRLKWGKISNVAKLVNN